MFNECRHILTSGHKCKAAALRGKAFCYYHTAARRYTNISTTSVDPLLLPSTDDTAGVQIAINQVLRGLASRRIDPRHAGVYFYGLQIAARLAGKSDEKPTETVRETCEDADGHTLAPEKSTCEPPADCVNCHRRSFCGNFRFHKRKVKELEERLEAERETTESELEDKED
ncbi:MAG TPA: hypothetical protein VK574_17320 [Terracidiphilus sp.]|nr:hypothetical protein [Terracidiphilus sp.]